MPETRHNLSQIKGMNVDTFAHKSNEVIELVNFKQTENGLEMRNGAKTLIESKTLDGIKRYNNIPYLNSTIDMGSNRFISLHITNPGANVLQAYINEYENEDIKTYGPFNPLNGSSNILPSDCGTKAFKIDATHFVVFTTDFNTTNDLVGIVGTVDFTKKQLHLFALLLILLILGLME